MKTFKQFITEAAYNYASPDPEFVEFSQRFHSFARATKKTPTHSKRLTDMVDELVEILKKPVRDSTLKIYSPAILVGYSNHPKLEKVIRVLKKAGLIVNDEMVAFNVSPNTIMFPYTEPSAFVSVWKGLISTGWSPGQHFKDHYLGLDNYMDNWISSEDRDEMDELLDIDRESLPVKFSSFQEEFDELSSKMTDGIAGGDHLNVDQIIRLLKTGQVDPNPATEFPVGSWDWIDERAISIIRAMSGHDRFDEMWKALVKAGLKIDDNLGLTLVIGETGLDIEMFELLISKGWKPGRIFRKDYKDVYKHFVETGGRVNGGYGHEDDFDLIDKALGINR